MGYFATGALAGALAAGIGAGVGGLVGGSGSFSFSVANSLTVGGVLPGMAIGAASGFTNGLITGMGNGLVEGNNLKTAFNSGLNVGTDQALWGAVLGGIQGGIRAAKYGGDIWTGKPVPVQAPTPPEILIPETRVELRTEGMRVEINSIINNPQTVIDYNIESIVGPRMGCTEYSIAAIDHSMGGDINPMVIRGWTLPGSNPNTTGLITTDALKAYSKHTGHYWSGFIKSDINMPQTINEIIKEKARALISVNEGHVMVLSKIVRSSSGYFYTVMDPANGLFYNLSHSTIQNGHAIYFIYP